MRVRGVLGAAGARTYFYWRLKRRFAEMRLTDSKMGALGCSYEEAAAAVVAGLPADDRAAYEALKQLVDLA